MLRIGRLRRVQGHHVTRFRKRRVILVRDLAQRLLLVRELPLGIDQGGGRGVVGGLGFLHVRDGNQPDVVPFVVLIELQAVGVQGRLVRVDHILSRQHIEVRRRDALDEALLRRLVVRLGLRDLLVRPAQRLPVRPGEHTLLQLQVVLPLVGVAGGTERQRLQLRGVDRGREGLH